MKGGVGLNTILSEEQGRPKRLLVRYEVRIYSCTFLLFLESENSISQNSKLWTKPCGNWHCPIWQDSMAAVDVLPGSLWTSWYTWSCRQHGVVWTRVGMAIEDPLFNIIRTYSRHWSLTLLVHFERKRLGLFHLWPIPLMNTSQLFRCWPLWCLWRFHSNTGTRSLWNGLHVVSLYH